LAFISLILAFSFLAIFIRNDHKEYPAFSARLWLPLIWLLLTSTRLLEIAFPVQGAVGASDAVEAYVRGNAMDRGVSAVLICLGLWALGKSKFNIAALIKDNAWLFLLHFYAFISIGWSDFPGISLKRWVRVFGSLIMALLVMVDDDYREAFEHIFRRYAAICLTLSVVLIRFYPRFGFVTGVMGTRSWAGVATHKNELAILCAFSLLFFIWRILKPKSGSRVYDIIGIFLAIYLLIRAGSATAGVASLIGLFMLFSMTLMKYNLKKVIIFTVILSFTIFFISTIFLKQSDADLAGNLYRAAGRDPTLTGRVPIWQFLLKLGSKKLVTGSGYESFWPANLAKVWARFAASPNNAHNGYLDVLLNLGIIGLIVLLILIVKSLIRLGGMGQMSSAHGRIVFVFFIIILLRNISESSMLNPSLSWFLFLLCSIRVGGSLREASAS